MSDPPASYIVEQAHLQCSVYCVCPMLDVTQTSCHLIVSMELSTPRVQALRISSLLCNANVLVDVCEAKRNCYRLNLLQRSFASEWLR